VRVQLFGVVGFDAVTFQLRTQLGEVLVVPRLDRAENVDRGNIRAGESAIVRNIQDTASFFCDDSRKQREPSRSIADGRGKSAEASVRSQTAFDDSSPVHTQLATQGICFDFIGVVGTHVRYRWYSTTFPDWNGIASQEGDQIFMHGDYDKDNGHDGFNWAIDTSKAGSGHWHEWREDGGFGITIGLGNAVFQRTGRCQTGTPGITLPVVPNQFASDGTLLENPIGMPTKQ